jgi:hypothetical protein
MYVLAFQLLIDSVLRSPTVAETFRRLSISLKASFHFDSTGCSGALSFFVLLQLLLGFRRDLFLAALTASRTFCLPPFFVKACTGIEPPILGGFSAFSFLK